MRLYIFVLGAICASSHVVQGAEDCNQHRKCAFGSIREDVLNFHGIDQHHPLLRALCTYRENADCPDPEIKEKQKKHCSHYSEPHQFTPQCYSSFTFTDAEAVVAHLLLITNAAIATTWLQKIK